MIVLSKEKFSNKNRGLFATLGGGGGATYNDATKQNENTTYPDLAARILDFSGCVTCLTPTLNVSIEYKGEKLPIQDESMILCFLKKVETS